MHCVYDCLTNMTLYVPFHLTAAGVTTPSPFFNVKRTKSTCVAVEKSFVNSHIKFLPTLNRRQREKSQRSEFVKRIAIASEAVRIEAILVRV